MSRVRSFACWAMTAVAVSLVASRGLGGQVAQFTITPGEVLRDERFRVTLQNLKPGQEVIIRVDGNRGAWHSSATFRTDDHGRVDVGDPMKLIWSATGERPAAAAPVQSWTFSAEVDGRVIARQTIVRHAVAESVRLAPVRERGLVGMAYCPPGAGPHPA